MSEYSDAQGYYAPGKKCMYCSDRDNPHEKCNYLHKPEPYECETSIAVGYEKELWISQQLNQILVIAILLLLLFY